MLWREALRRVLKTQYKVPGAGILEEVPYTLETGTKLRQGGLFLDKPSALLIFAPAGIAVLVMQGTVNLDADIMFLLMSQSGIERVRQSLIDSPVGAAGIAPRVFAVSPMPLPSTADSQIAASFRAAVADYGLAGVTATSGRFEGYVTGRFVLQAIAQVQGRLTRESVMDVLYQLGKVQLDDMVFDNFTDDARFCTPLRPLLCPCNQMSRSIYISTLNGDDQLTIRPVNNTAGFVPFKVDACGWEATLANQLPIEYRDLPEAGSVLVLVLSCLMLLLCLLLGVLIFVYRSRSIISSSNLGFMYLTLLGLMLTYADVIPWALKPTDLTCALIPILGGLGFVLVVGYVFVPLCTLSLSCEAEPMLK